MQPHLFCEMCHAKDIMRRGKTMGSVLLCKSAARNELRQYSTRKCLVPLSRRWQHSPPSNFGLALTFVEVLTCCRVRDLSLKTKKE